MRRATLDLRSFCVGWLTLLALWCFFSYIIGVPSYLLASPRRVLDYIAADPGTVAIGILLTGSQALAGWVIALVLGIGLGVLAFYLKTVRRVALPIVLISQTTPVIALVPLVTLWLGYGWLAKSAVACIVAIFPIIVATYSGMGDAKAAHVYLFKLAGASEITILTQVRLKSALAALLPAVKVSIVFAVIGSIVAEFMGGNRGLGFLIMVATYGTKSDLLITAILASAILGQAFLLAVEFGTARLEKTLGLHA